MQSKSNFCGYLSFMAVIPTWVICTKSIDLMLIPNYLLVFEAFTLNLRELLKWLNVLLKQFING